MTKRTETLTREELVREFFNAESLESEYTEMAVSLEADLDDPAIDDKYWNYCDKAQYYYTKKKEYQERIYALDRAN